MPRRKCQGTDIADPHQKIAGGAPRGERPRSQGGAGASHAPATRRHRVAGVSRKHPAPSRRSAAPHRAAVKRNKTRAHERAAGTKKLRCLTP